MGLGVRSDSRITALLPSVRPFLSGCDHHGYPEYSRANSYPWSPFPPRRARPGPGPHRGASGSFLEAAEPFTSPTIRIRVNFARPVHLKFGCEIQARPLKIRPLKMRLSTGTGGARVGGLAAPRVRNYRRRLSLTLRVVHLGRSTFHAISGRWSRRGHLLSSHTPPTL